MSGGDMLDQRKTKARSTTASAISAVKTFGKTRKVIFRNAVTIISNAQARFGITKIHANVDYRLPPWRGPIFYCIPDQVFDEPDQFVAISQNKRLLFTVHHDFDALLSRQNSHSVYGVSDNRYKIDVIFWP